MSSDKRLKSRLALVLASIHTGSSSRLWTSVADVAEASGYPLFIFPGGRLDALDEFEYLRNSIYRLVNSDNVDAVISWGSSLTGTVGVEEAVDFHKRFSGMPLVTIALKIPGHPDVRFDAYHGMKTLVLHCIRTHRARRIACIRGPLNHSSAEERYRAYLDAIKESGIEVDERLVSPPCPWHGGEQALAELIDVRHLIPGKDFDMIVCASDLLMLNAAKVLQRDGYRIPEDVGIVGFNDSPESRFLCVPGTTVRVPFNELGKTAFNALIGSLAEDLPPESIVLPAEPVIRYSCGCSLLDQGNAQLRESYDKNSFCEWVVKRFSLEEDRQRAWLLPLVDELYRGQSRDEPGKLCGLLRTVLNRYFQNDPDTSEFQQVIEAISRLEDIDQKYLGQAVARCRALALETQSRISNSRNYESIRRSQCLNSFKCELLKAWSRESIPRIMAGHLPALGIRQAFLVLSEDDAYSRYVGGYSELGPTGMEDEVFPAHRLLPEPIAALCGSNVYFVQPLFIENQALGYLVTAIGDRDAAMHEELRSSIGSALKGVLLFEETVRAKEIAERAEQAKMDFFSTMGEGLKEPLAIMVDKLDQLNDMVLQRTDNPASLEHAVASVREDLAVQLERTTLLFDYTLAQAGSLELNERLCSVKPMLLSLGDSERCRAVLPADIPLVKADAKRIGQVLSIMLDLFANRGSPVSLEAVPKPEGLAMRFEGSVRHRIDRAPGSPVALAESLMLLHRGSMEIGAGYAELFLPWPNLGDIQPSAHSDVRGLLLVLTDRETAPAAATGFAERNGMEMRLLPAREIVENPSGAFGGTVLYWDADSADTEQFLAVKMLHRHHTLFRIPVMCFGDALQGSSLIESVGLRLNAGQAGPVAVWDGVLLPDAVSRVLENLIAVHDADRFDILLEERRPSLVILGSFDFALLRAIREKPKSATVPVVMLVDRMPGEESMERLCSVPQTVVCHTAVARYPEFGRRLREIASGSELLPAHTGALVKRAQHYIAEHACGMMARWKIADSVNASEDYLTRIFKRELGLSPWEYLSRYRIELACTLLTGTDLPLSEVAEQTGFQDQAYFCRVFKKLKRTTPGALRCPQVGKVQSFP